MAFPEGVASAVAERPHSKHLIEVLSQLEGNLGDVLSRVCALEERLIGTPPNDKAVPGRPSEGPRSLPLLAEFMHRCNTLHNTTRDISSHLSNIEGTF